MNLIKATGAAINTAQLFLNFPYKKLKITCEKCKKIIGTLKRQVLVQKIFRASMELILNDIIDNNITFQLPTGNRKCDIHMDVIEGERFKTLKRKGKWRNVDFLKSNFTGHQLALYMYSHNRPPRVKNIYVNKEMTNRIDENTNNGKTYC